MPIPPEHTTVVERRYVAGQLPRGRDELRELFAHASLLRALVHRDLTIRYKRSLLGFLWTMLHPLLLMLIFVLVFSGLFERGGAHYETYFLSAYVAWNFLAQTLTQAMASMAWNGPLMKRARVPLSIFTLATTLSGLVNLGLSLLVLWLVMLIAGAPLPAAMLCLPLGLLVLGVFTLGAALALSALCIHYGDVREMTQAALPALMYLTPIIYPLEIVPERFRWLIELNPLGHLIELVRAPIYHGRIPGVADFALGAGIALLSLLVGWAIFRRLSPGFHAQL